MEGLLSTGPSPPSFTKSSYYGDINIWNNSDVPLKKNKKNWKIFCLDNFCLKFALETMSLPRKIMEQCKLCQAKLWSNADFAPQNPGAFILCPAQSQSLYTLLRKIMEQCTLCPAKSWRHSFIGQNNSKIYLKTRFCSLFFLILLCVNLCYFGTFKKD